jgi:serine/threonine protein kinase
MLAELVKMDQEGHWQAGDRRPLEWYLDHWVELKSDPQFLADLLEAECRTRLAVGLCPTVAELRERFGDVAGRIDLEAILDEERSHGPASPAGSPDGGPADEHPGDQGPSVAEPGSRFGKYLIRRVVGSGGMATVYEAEDTELQRQVAVKVPHRYVQASPAASEFFFKEARAAAALAHPGIVAIFNSDQLPDGTCFLVFEFIPGESLDRLIQAGRVTHTQAAEWAAEIADAMHYAHQRGFVHRDLKPGNILIDPQGRTHLADFGLAVHESGQRRRAGESSGTLAYMAPEQVRGEVQWQDGRSDIWSLGVTLYELLTRRRPFGAETATELRHEILSRDPKPPTAIDDAIPEQLERICLKCLAKPPADRYSNAAAVGRDLRGWLHQRRRPFVPALTALAIGMALLLALWALGPWKTGSTSPDQQVPPQPGGLVSLEGEITVTIWNKNLPGRLRLPLDGPGAVPLRPGDRVRVEAKLNSPAYAYVIWIDTQGQPIPMYPWLEGDWKRRGHPEVPVAWVSLPDGADEGFPIRGPPGMETLILLARQDPLPNDADIAALLGVTPRLAIADADGPLCFTEGRLVGQLPPSRAPAVGHRQPLDDPLLRAQREIHDKLSRYFALHRAVCFANQVEQP